MNGRTSIVSSAFLTVVLASCAGAGGNGAATPPVVPTNAVIAAGDPGSPAQNVRLGLAQTVTFAPIASGASAVVAFPATLAGAGTARVSLQSTRPVGVPPFKLGLSPLAFVVVKPSSTLTFSASPGIDATFPAGELAGYAYVASYDTANPHLGWKLVAGPVQAKGKSVTLPSTLQEPPMSLGAAKNYLFAIVQRPNVLATPSPAPGTITEYGIPGTTGVSVIQHVTAGPDGNLWFIEEDGSIGESVAKFTTTGKITRYPLKEPPYDDPKSIIAGLDGNMWFTETNNSRIGKMTTDGVLTEYPVTEVGSAPWEITPGPDGNMWFTEPDFELGAGLGSGAIGKITTNGVITDYPLAIPAGQVGVYAPSPLYIKTGPDGNLWFTLASCDNRFCIGRITPQGVITLYKVPLKYSEPYGIVSGPGGKMWFTDSSNGQIDSITMSGVVKQYGGGSFTSLNEITVGSDGNLWVADYNSRIDRLTPQGVLTQYPTPTQPSGPQSIVAGPDGNIWFSETGVPQLGKVFIAKRTHGKGASIHD